MRRDFGRKRKERIESLKENRRRNENWGMRSTRKRIEKQREEEFKDEKDKGQEKKRKEVGYKRRQWRRGKDKHKMSRIVTDSVGSCWLQAKQGDHKM
jgi:hypothetical protein